MKSISRHIITLLLVAVTAVTAVAQDSSASSVVRRRGDNDRQRNQGGAGQVTSRMQQRYEDSPVSDADLAWMRVIYRILDLTKDENAPLYSPDEPVDGQENMFRIIMRLLAEGRIAAYEYLDGREMFTDQYRIKVKDMLDRFHILYTDAKGSTEKHPRFTIDDSDVPANEVLSYYIVERWEFDRRDNRMRSRIEAICPVLHRSGDFGGEAVKYPMFWLKFDELRPFLTTQTVFVDDDNNLPSCTYDDFFQLGLYKGDIYKTRNLRNRSLMQQFPEQEDLKRAQDSIQHRLDTYASNLWVPSLEELAAMREKREALEAGNDSTSVASVEKADKPKRTTRSSRTARGKKDVTASKTKVKKPKAPKTQKSSGSATRSVRNRRR